MAEAGSGRKWFKWGCFGCLGLIALILLLVGVLFGVAWLGVRSEQVEKQTLTPEIPRAGEPTELDLPPAGPGRVILELQQGGFHVLPGEPGEPLRVEAQYDANTGKLHETLETGDGPGWVYRLVFHGSSGSLMHGLRALLGGTGPEIWVYLPPDVPLELELRLTQGGADIQLGGLWLNELDIDFDMAGIELGVDSPLQAPMERCSIRGAMGGLESSQLGNASPRVLDVDYKMGGLELDLRGRWVNDSDIEIRFSRGGGEIRLPDGVRIEGLQTGRIEPPVESEIPPPTLRFSATSDLGELTIAD